MVEHYKIKLQKTANVLRFENYLKELNIDFKKIEYFPNYVIYKIRKLEEELIEKISKSKDVRTILPMQRYFLDFKSKKIEDAKIDIGIGTTKENVPVVGVIDNGIERLPQIKSWLYEDGKNYCAEKRTNTHGTFVAGVILQYLQNAQIKIYDGAIVPDFNLVQLEEDELFLRMKKLVEEHSFIKVWNLAISIRISTSPDYISDFGAILDFLQEKYNILIVKSAGNGEFKNNILEKKMILEGADSARALVVSSCNSNNEVSSFSLSGIGHKILTKPDIATYGGDVSFDENNKIKVEGVLSLSPKDDIVSSFGTSFATAKITGMIGKILSINSSLSPLFLKAFFVHMAKEPQEYILGYGYIEKNIKVEEELKKVSFIEGEIDEYYKLKVKFKNYQVSMVTASDIEVDYNDDNYIVSDLEFEMTYKGKKMKNQYGENSNFNSVKKYQFIFDEKDGEAELMVLRRKKLEHNLNFKKMKFCIVFKNEK